MKVAFMYLNAYSSVGGIQQYNKNFVDALSKLKLDFVSKISLLSLHDEVLVNDKQTIVDTFKRARKNRLFFLIQSIIMLFKSDIVILGHINLCFPITMINQIFFRKKIYTIIHGIEAWEKYGYLKTLSIRLNHQIFSVSDFTSSKASILYDIPLSNFSKVTNVLNPSIEYAISDSKPQFLMERYGLNSQHKIILTIARISKKEKSKGYDKVIRALVGVKKQCPNIKYILAGKYDEQEYQRLNSIIEENKLQEQVILTGYIPDSELVAHYQLCDLFVMPSSKEGFGIVFIESAACGKPSIAGNLDGSIEAILNGKNGKLIDPNSNMELENSIVDFFDGQWNPSLYKASELREQTIKHFSLEQMQLAIKNALSKSI